MKNEAIELSNSLNGYLDEIRVSNTARYTSTFTPSTTAFESDANTKLLIHGEALAAAGKITRIHGTSLAWSIPCITGLPSSSTSSLVPVTARGTTS